MIASEALKVKLLLEGVNSDKYTTHTSPGQHGVIKDDLGLWSNTVLLSLLLLAPFFLSCM